MRRTFIIICLLLSIFLGLGGNAGAQYSTVEVKAAFLFNFAQFTSWPAQHAPQQEGGLVVGIMGRNPFGPALLEFQTKKLLGQPVQIRAVSTLQEARSCHILYIAASEATKLRRILRQLKQPGILTVSDIPGFASRGGMIELLEIEQRIRFAVNLRASRKAGLVLSSHLLKLARNVISAEEDNP